MRRRRLISKKMHHIHHRIKYVACIRKKESSVKELAKCINNHPRICFLLYIVQTRLNSSPLDKMAAMYQKIFSDAFSWMKSLYHYQKFTDVCSEGPNRQKASIGLDNGLTPNRRQAIIWTDADYSHWRIYVALGGDELTTMTNSFL